MERPVDSKASLYGPSMWPFVWSGARLPIESCAIDDLCEGDIAAVWTELGVVLHRVVEIDGVLVTRGDWNSIADAPITTERLVGRVRGVALGRWSVPAPRVVARRVNQLVVAAHPLVQRLRTRERIAALRRAREWLARSPVGDVVRGPGEVSVRVLDARDGAELRRSSWSRGRYAPSLHAQLRALLEGEGGCVIGAMHPRGLVGQVLLHTRADGRALATDFWVSPWHRGRGLGRALAELAIREAETRSVRELSVLVRRGTHSHALWTHLGLEEDTSHPVDDPATMRLRLFVARTPAA